MILQGSWNYQALKTGDPQFVKDGKLGYVAFPAVAGGKGDPANVVGNPSNFWSISSKATASEKKAALRLHQERPHERAATSTTCSKVGAVPPVAGHRAQAHEDRATPTMTSATSTTSRPEGAELPALLGPGAQPGPGRRAADQPGQDLPRSRSPPSSSPPAMNATIGKLTAVTVSTASTPAAARVPARDRPRRTGAKRAAGRCRRSLFFVVFALVPLAGVVVLSFAELGRPRRARPGRG